MEIQTVLGNLGRLWGFAGSSSSTLSHLQTHRSLTSWGGGGLPAFISPSCPPSSLLCKVFLDPLIFTPPAGPSSLLSCLDSKHFDCQGGSMVNTQLALYAPALSSRPTCPARWLRLQNLDPRSSSCSPHHGHLLAGPEGLSLLSDRAPPAHSPAASAHPDSYKGKDLWCWEPINSKEQWGGRSLEPVLGMLDSSLFTHPPYLKQKLSTPEPLIVEG